VKRPALRGVLLFAGRSMAARGKCNVLISLDIPRFNSLKYNLNLIH